MARLKLSEFRAKTMLTTALGTSYDGLSIDTTQPYADELSALPDDGRFVVKVDQAIKKRMKQGLVKLDRTKTEVSDDLQSFAAQGYRYCLVEPLRPHEPGTEKYLALQADRDGTSILFSTAGGIDIETAAESVQRLLADDTGLTQAAQVLDVPEPFLQTIRDAFDASYSCFLEINPLLSGPTPVALDVAVEVDGEAANLTRPYWTEADVRSYRQQTPEEQVIGDLAAKSRSSLRYEIINPDGAVWLLLSGGGASVTVADEVNNRGYGHLLGNYGEYSGNPTEPETFGYTEQLLHSLLQSQAAHKVLIIAGGVANFTDVRTTFSGVIRALNKYAAELQAAGVKVFVRRGGPHETEGLALMRDCLATHDLLGDVHGPELPLADSVSAALASLEATA